MDEALTALEQAVNDVLQCGIDDASPSDVDYILAGIDTLRDQLQDRRDEIVFP